MNSLLGPTSPKKTDCPSPNSHQLPITSQIEMRFHELLSHPCCSLGCINLMQVYMKSYPLWAHVCNSLVMSNTYFFAVDNHYFWFTILPPLFYDIPQAWGDGYGIDVTFRAECSLVSYSVCTDQLWVSALIVTYCKKKLLWRGLRDAPIYEYKHKHLSGSLILYLSL